MANAKNTNSHTHTTLVYTDDPNSTWRIATSTLPFSFLAYGQHLYSSPPPLFWHHKRHHSKQAHIRFIDIFRSAPDAMMTLTTHGKKKRREPCHLHFSAGTLGRVEEGNRAVPLPGPEDTLCWISNSNRSALPLSRPRPHLPFSCSFYVLCEKSRSAAPSCNGTISQNWRKQSIKPSSICWGQSR
ncbi:hypothetical protein FJTKL_01081 [Diaporthe vaccinii]|uniref:Uncharacterized protein n=1 Tax=Diaporthe vaccinii TaxID=105482 RepID=A0ABR4F4Y9_9PEZI